jgi:hypothetical protein
VTTGPGCRLQLDHPVSQPHPEQQFHEREKRPGPRAILIQPSNRGETGRSPSTPLSRRTRILEHRLPLTFAQGAGMIIDWPPNAQAEFPGQNLIA